MSKRPEHEAPPEIYYNDDEARKYTENSRIVAVQADMTLRALELLNLPVEQQCLILDIGCGSGLSSEVIEDEGHIAVGLDISPSMLEVARDREIDCDLFLQDIGDGVGFRPGCFDGAISISVIQWLCNADKSYHEPKRRLNRFFSTLYTSLARGARAVFQFYPENPDQVEMIVNAATKSGFTGGLVVDYPNSTKAKKYFLCLFAGYADTPSSTPQLPQGLGEEGHEPTVAYSNTRIRESRRRKTRVAVKSKAWIQSKKDTQKSQGKRAAEDSKYTGRKRKPKF